MDKTYAVIDESETNLTDDIRQAREWLAQSNEGSLYRKICSKAFRYWALKPVPVDYHNQREWVRVGASHSRLEFRSKCISQHCEMYDTLVIEISEAEHTAAMIRGITNL